MITKYRRTYRGYRGDSAMQMLFGAFILALVGILFGVAFADWMTGFDTLATIISEAMR